MLFIFGIRVENVQWMFFSLKSNKITMLRFYSLLYYYLLLLFIYLGREVLSLLLLNQIERKFYVLLKMKNEGKKRIKKIIYIFYFF